MSRRLEEEQERVLQTLKGPLPPDPEELEEQENKKAVAAAKKSKGSKTLKQRAPKVLEAILTQEEDDDKYLDPDPFGDEAEV